MTTKDLQDLEQIPRRMAEAIGPLFDRPTRERYVRFLNAMYYYTRPSGDQLRIAARNAPTEDLRAMFEEMSMEEVSHFRLAEADLEGLGYPLNSSEPPAVTEFNAFWNSITPGQAFRYLGAMYVLENVAHFLRENAAQALAELGVKQDQARFVQTHLVADEEHGALLRRFAERYLPNNQEDILFGARRAAELWVKIHLDTMIGESVRPNQYRPIEMPHDLSPEDFVKRYRSRHQPVILSSFAKDWPALSTWTPEFLKSRYGSLSVSVYDSTFGTQGKNYLRDSGSMRFDEYLSLILAGPTDKRLFLFRLLEVAPELKRDLLFPEGYGRFDRRHVFLFFGGAGSAPTFHYDVDLPHVYHTVLHGRKRVFLFAPDQSRKLYQHPLTVRSYVDVTNPDYVKFPRFRDTVGYECVLTKGQTLFIPSGFWHQILYETGTYAVSYRQYEWQRIPSGLYNMFIRETIDTALNRLASSKWFEWKIRQAERRAG